MDMQNKLIINHTFHGFMNEVDLDCIDDDSILFEFNEYEPIVILLKSKRYKVVMECYSYYDSEYYQLCENNELSLSDNYSYKISDSNNTVDIGYIPSRYVVSVINLETGNKKNCFFNVNSNKDLSEDGMENMINHINNFIDGLSIDFFRNSRINSINSSSNNSDYYIYELIKTYSSQISYRCDNVIKKITYNISSNIKIDKMEKRQNYKTIKKNIIKRNEKIYFNLKKEKSSNCIDNVILKKYLINIMKILKRHKLNLDIFINEQKNKIIKYSNDKKKINQKIEQNVISKTDLKDLKNTIRSKDGELANTTQLYNKLLGWEKSYNDSIINILKLLELDELANLTLKNDILYSASFYSNNDYRFFAELYNELIKDNTSEYKKHRKNLFSDKRSYTLFEIFGFIVIQNILKQIGFEFILGDDNLFTFGSDCEFWYKKDEYKIRIQYDHYCLKYRNTENLKNGDIVNKNSVNCKPDYIISVFKNDILYDAIVVEMKYRKLRYLTDFNGGSTETDATIDDYSQLCGVVNDLKKPKNIISDVIILYPSLNEKIFDRNSGIFIGINAEKDFIDSNGYLTLKNKIENLIK